MGKAKSKKKSKTETANIEQSNVPAVTEDIQTLIKSVEALKAQKKKLTDEVLQGKCPIHVFERDGVIQWEYSFLREPHNTIHDAFKALSATTDYALASEIISNGVIALPSNVKSSVEKYNIAFQALADSAPKDATEAKLCLQATALYSQGMAYLSRAERSNMLDHGEHYMRNAIKLLRLHNETIEALSKYRRGGEQRVLVQHVNVENGGRAIIGSVLNGGGGDQQKNSEVPHGHNSNL